MLELGTILPKDDPELVDFVRRRLRADGVDIVEGAKIKRVEGDSGAIAEQRLSAAKVLIADVLEGREPPENDQAAGFFIPPTERRDFGVVAKHQASLNVGRGRRHAAAPAQR